VSFVYVCVWFLSTVIDFLFTESIRWPSYWRHSEMTYISNNSVCHTAIENLSDPIGYLLDSTNPYYTALAGNMKACAEKDNSFWNHM
jgi:hypothetical protein